MSIRIDPPSTSNRISNPKDSDMINLNDARDYFKADAFDYVPSRGSTKRNPIDVDDYEDADYGDDPDFKRAIHLSLLDTPEHKRRKAMWDRLANWRPKSGPSVEGRGESSRSAVPRRVDMWMTPCEMCVQCKRRFEFVNIVGCEHSVCYGCMRKFIVSNLGIGVCPSTCPLPECQGLLLLDNCSHVLSEKICSQWSDMLCKSVVSSLGSFSDSTTDEVEDIDDTEEENDDDAKETDPGDVKKERGVAGRRLPGAGEYSSRR